MTRVTTNARLRALVELAQSGSVRGAAKVLSVTESSVSSAVTALARDVGVPLVEPDGRGVRLTDAGAAYARYARRILGLHAEAVAAARSAADPDAGVLRIAAVTTAGEHVLPGLLASFRARHPHVEVRLDVRHRDAIWPMLADHEVDVVIAGRPPEELAGGVRATRQNTLVVVGASGRDAGFDPRTATWLLREPGSGTRATCLAMLAALDAEPPLLTLGAHGAVVAGARVGLGVTLVSRQAVDALVERGELAILPALGTPVERPWHLVCGDRATATTQRLVTHVLGRPEWSAPA